MNTSIFTTFVAGLLVALPASAGTIAVGASFPAAGDFATDATSGPGSGSQLQVADNRGFVGQSFTLGTAGDSDFLFNSITFLINDQGEMDEPTQSLGLHIFEGIPGAMGTELIEVQFTATTTFDATAGNFVTFALTEAESATLGALTAGTEYSAVLRPDDDTADGGSQFRIVRSATPISLVDGGTAIFGGNPVGDFGADAVFQVNVTQVPEPSSIALLICGLIGFGARRRRV